MKKITSLFIIAGIFCVMSLKVIELVAEDRIPASAPMTTDLAGKSGTVAAHSVLRVSVPSKNKGGTAFLHKSGKVITAAHIVKDCSSTDVFLIDSQGQRKDVTKIVSDNDYDLALLTPKTVLKRASLPINASNKLSIGAQVTTWGYPSGYKGLVPLLSVGYLSGVETIKSDSGKLINRWVVNAAFNRGNSGGPLIHIEDGTVIGIVVSKLAPIPPYIESALEALKNQKQGFTYTKTSTDGRTGKVSEGQIIADILDYLRSQTQLVVGYAVLLEDLRKFLREKGIEP